MGNDINRNSIQRNRSKKQSLHKGMRFIIQLVFFALFPSAYNACFAGVKYIFTQIGMNQWIGLAPFVVVLIVLCLYTVIFGRFFCGYACAFGAMGDWIFGIHVLMSKRRGKRTKKIPEHIMAWLSLIKFPVLFAIIILEVTRTFDKTAGMSPWDAFSQARAGQWDTLASYKIGCILLGMIIICMFFSDRFFCRVLCPMGAVFSLLPILPLFSLNREKGNCLQGCQTCTKHCPAAIELPDRKLVETPGDCFQCHQCLDSCPCGDGGNIRTKIRKLKGNEVWFTLVRSAVLIALFIWMGV